MPYIPIFTDEELASMDYYDALFLRSLNSLPGINAIYDAIDQYLNSSRDIIGKEPMQ